MTAIYLLTADVAAAVLICPVAYAALPPTSRLTRWSLAILVLWLLASASALASMGMAPSSIALSHMMLATVALASAGIGRALGTLFVDPLDAIASGTCVCLALSLGVFVIGRFAGELPPDVLNAVLAVNPLVATASAANVDIFRTELLYRASPIPHLLFDYPSWLRSAGFFSAVTVVCFGFSKWRLPSGTRSA
jgi:hypothetical protein